MKSNPYVYPSVNFPRLQVADAVSKTFDETRVEMPAIIAELQKIQHPKLNITGATKAEKIFSIFLDVNVLFGPKNFLTQNKKAFLESINYFIEKNIPIQLTMLGFPFKMEVIIKTNRVLPDMGEMLILNKMFFIAKNIASIYKPGAVLTLFTEESFAGIVKNNEENGKKYVASLRSLIKSLGYQDQIKICSLGEVEKDAGFEMTFKKNKTEIAQAVKKEEGIFFEKFSKSCPVLFRVVSASGISRTALFNMYSMKSIDELTDKEKGIYNRLLKTTQTSTVGYLAYLKTKDDLNFLNKKIGVHLPLTVSPKLGRLGVMPIGKKVKILPYHGVPIKNAKTGEWDVKYLCEVEFNSKKYTKVFLKGDKDTQPFYYIQNN